MSDKAIEVIAALLTDYDPWDELTAARRIVATLKAAGIVAVELPPPDSTRYEGDEHEPADRLCWMPGDDFEVSVWHPGEVQRYGYGWGDITPLTAVEARTIGLALLAAAQAAGEAR